jgi:hypothetical protein
MNLGWLKTAAVVAGGTVIPIKTSSRVYLGQKFEQCGITHLPEAAVQELADDAVHLCKAEAELTGVNWRAGVADWLDGRATNVAHLLHDDRDPVGRQLVSDQLRERLTAILNKHDVAVPQIDRLKGH